MPIQKKYSGKPRIRRTVKAVPKKRATQPNPRLKAEEYNYAAKRLHESVNRLEKKLKSPGGQRFIKEYREKQKALAEIKKSKPKKLKIRK